MNSLLFTSYVICRSSFFCNTLWCSIPYYFFVIHCNVVETSCYSEKLKKKSETDSTRNLYCFSKFRVSSWQDHQFSGPLSWGSQQANVSKHVKSASNGFLFRSMLGCNCPKKSRNYVSVWMLWGNFGGEVLVQFSPSLKPLATLMGLIESSRTCSSLSFIWSDRIEILMAYHSKDTRLNHHRNPSNYMNSQIPPLTHPPGIWFLTFAIDNITLDASPA